MEEIYLRYYTQMNKPFKMPDGTYLVTQVRHQIALLKAPVKYRDFLLAQRCGCCGNSSTCFRVATQAEIDTWLE